MKCILILIFFGLVFPRLIDYTIDISMSKSKLHNNSILVYNIYSTNKHIIYNFIYLFKLTICQ